MKSIGIFIKSSNKQKSKEDNSYFGNESVCNCCILKIRDTLSSLFNHSNDVSQHGITKEQTISDTKDSSDVELHINIWKFRKNIMFSEDKFFIDMGIMTNLQNDEIGILLPFLLQKTKKENQWDDLGMTICNNKDNLICALFNEDLKAIPHDNRNFYLIKPYDNSSMDNNVVKTNKSFYFYLLGRNNVTIEEDTENEETLLKIKVEGINNYINDRDCDKYYLRFRLFVKDPKNIKISHSLSNDLIQAAFSKLDLYDIRINEQRNLNRKATEHVIAKNYKFAKFSKIHIFYIANTKVSVETSSSVKQDSRIIEPRIWDSYEPKGLGDGIYIAHHWKSGRDSSQFSLFFTVKYPKITKTTLAAYLSFVIILSGIGSWLTSDSSTSIHGIKLWIIIALIIIILLELIRFIRIKFKIWVKDR